MNVRESARFIAEHSESVQISEDGVNTLAKDLIEAMTQNTSYSGPRDWVKHPLHPNPASLGPLAAAQWVLMMDTLNFCFWRRPDAGKVEGWAVENEGCVYRGYWAMCAALQRGYRELGSKLLSADFWVNASMKEWENVFRSHGDGARMPLLERRVEVLREAGNVLLDKYDGQFSGMIREAGGSAQKLIAIVTAHLSSFRDEGDYLGQHVRLYKRVQILIADVWGCFGGEGLGSFHDIDSLTMFADYRVPQILVGRGVMLYCPALLARLQAGEEIASRSREEMEIRGCSIHAVEKVRERMCELAPERTAGVNSVLIDFYLWDLAKAQAAQLENIPIHLTTSIYY